MNDSLNWELRCQHAEAAYATSNDGFLAMRAERDAALAAVAEMRTDCQSILDHFMHLLGSKVQADCGCFLCTTLKHALSTDCGKGWVSPERFQECLNLNLKVVNDNLRLNKHLALAVEALEKIASCPVIIKGDCPSIAQQALATIKGQPHEPAHQAK